MIADLDTRRSVPTAKRSPKQLLKFTGRRQDGTVADNPVRTYLRRRRTQREDERRAWHEQQIGTVRERQQVPDADLIARAPGFPGPAYEMEMQRRLKVAITELTRELVSFRTSSDVAASGLERLTRQRGRWLVRFTIALTVLTVAVVVLTAVLLAK